jgi:HSP20 family molecular chaperone IbpA
MKQTTTTTPFPSMMMGSCPPTYPTHEFAGMLPWGSDYMPREYTPTMMPSFGGFPGFGGNTMMPMGGNMMGGNYGGFGGNMMGGNYGGFGGNMMTPFGGFGGNTMMPSGGNFEREMFGSRNPMMRAMENMNRFFTNELNYMPSRPASMMENYTLANPIRMDAEGNRWLNCCFDMRSYKPEEINVTFNSKERCICIEANHEVKDTKDHYIKRHYSRKFYIPETIKDDISKMELKSCLTSDGMLTIEAALPKMAITGPTTGMSTGMNVTPLNVKMI